ncbi:chemotaxis protein [Escherichia coli]|nr:chemotaxis protein [Escherichia coli]
MRADTATTRCTGRNRRNTAVTNGAIVIHTQRLKSDPGGNLLS